jgi:uncharacterized paraquat-inducible protein A
MMGCPTCGTAVSTEAASCPKCGHQFKAPGAFNPLHDPVHGCAAAILVIPILVIVLLMLGAMFKC